MTNQHPWTGEPQRRWAETTWATAPDLPDPAPFPPYRSYDSFHRNIAVPEIPTYASGWKVLAAAAAFAAIFIVWNLVGRAGFPGTPWMLVGAGGCGIIGGLLLARAKVMREPFVARTWTDSVDNATPVHWFGTKLVLHYSGSDDGPDVGVTLNLLIDARLPVGQIAHIRQAVRVWTAALPVNRKGDARIPREVKRLVQHRISGSRAFVPAERVFGPGAVGAWFWYDQNDDTVYSPHALLVRDPAGQKFPRVLRSKAPRDPGRAPTLAESPASDKQTDKYWPHGAQQV
jgi:hypothetical protein